MEALGGDQPDGGFVGSRGIGQPAAQHLDAGQVTTDPALEVDRGAKGEEARAGAVREHRGHVDPPLQRAVLDERQLAHAGEGLLGLFVGALRELGGRGLREVEATADPQVGRVGPREEAAVRGVRAARPGSRGDGHAGAECDDRHEQREGCSRRTHLRPEPETGGGPPSGHAPIVALPATVGKGARPPAAGGATLTSYLRPPRPRRSVSRRGGPRLASSGRHAPPGRARRCSPRRARSR